MIRGVNKRLVEIAKTDNEYFERVFLIVREDKLAEDDKVLKAKADEYLKDIIITKPTNLKRKKIVKAKSKKISFIILRVAIFLSVIGCISYFIFR